MSKRKKSDFEEPLLFLLKLVPAMYVAKSWCPLLRGKPTWVRRMEGRQAARRLNGWATHKTPKDQPREETVAPLLQKHTIMKKISCAVRSQNSQVRAVAWGSKAGRGGRGRRRASTKERKRGDDHYYEWGGCLGRLARVGRAITWR